MDSLWSCSSEVITRVVIWFHLQKTVRFLLYTDPVVLALYNYKPLSNLQQSSKINFVGIAISSAHRIQHAVFTIGAIVGVIHRSSFINKSLQLINVLLTLTRFWRFYCTEFLWRGNQTLFTLSPWPNTKGKKAVWPRKAIHVCTIQ